MDPEETRLPNYRRCFVCGPDNPAGLKMDFRKKDDVVVAQYLPQEKQAGFEGVIHGGVVSAVLDEAMFWAIYAFRQAVCITAEITVRLKRPISPGAIYGVAARVVSADDRLFRAEADLADDRGNVCATGRGKFILMAENERSRVADELV